MTSQATRAATAPNPQRAHVVIANGCGEEVITMPTVCAEGCYKHYVNGEWVCCKCGG